MVRRGLALVVAAVALALFVVAAVHFWPGRARDVREGCPRVVNFRSGANQDFANVFHWRDRTYLDASVLAKAPDVGDATLGPELTTVGCSWAELSGDKVPEKGPWPDRSATFLPSGTSVRSVRGWDAGCLVGAESDGKVVVFVAVTDPAWTIADACQQQ